MMSYTLSKKLFYNFDVRLLAQWISDIEQWLRRILEHLYIEETSINFWNPLNIQWYRSLMPQISELFRNLYDISQGGSYCCRFTSIREHSTIFHIVFLLNFQNHGTLHFGVKPSHHNYSCTGSTTILSLVAYNNLVITTHFHCWTGLLVS